jgi:hypothetical protein
MIKKIILLLVFAFFIDASEKEFIISYRVVVQNNKVLSEKFNAVLSMNQSNLQKGKKIVDIDCKGFKIVKNCIIYNQDKITQELFKIGILVNDSQTKKTFNIDTKTVLVLPPTRVIIKIKEDFVTIYLKN